MSQWMSRASPLGHNSSILSCRGKTSLRLWKTQFTRSINCHSYATHKTNTLQGLDCDAIQWRRTFFRLVSFRYTSDEIRGFCVCVSVCVCGISIQRCWLLGRRLGHAYSFAVSWKGACLSSGGLLTHVRLHARECFLTQIPAGWESKVRKEKGVTMK